MTERFTLTLDLDNAAFDGGRQWHHETARILRETADLLDRGVEFSTPHGLNDSNGCRVGELEHETERIYGWANHDTREAGLMIDCEEDRHNYALRLNESELTQYVHNQAEDWDIDPTNVNYSELYEQLHDQ